MIANVLALSGAERAYFSNDTPLPAALIDRTIPDFESELQAALRSDPYREQGETTRKHTDQPDVASEPPAHQHYSDEDPDTYTSDRAARPDGLDNADNPDHLGKSEPTVRNARTAATDDDTAQGDDGSQIEQLHKEKQARRLASRGAEDTRTTLARSASRAGNVPLPHAADEAAAAIDTAEAVDSAVSADAAQDAVFMGEALPKAALAGAVSAEKNEGAVIARPVASHVAGHDIGDVANAAESKSGPHFGGQIVPDHAPTEHADAEHSELGQADGGGRGARARVEVIDLSSGNDTAGNYNSTKNDGEGQLLQTRQGIGAGGERLAAETPDHFLERLQGRLRDTQNTRIVQHARFLVHNNRNEGEIRLLLRPEQLGKVRVQLQLLDSQVSGRIIVENNAVRDVFEQNLAHLQREFRAQGFESAGIEVAVENGRQSEYAAQQPRIESLQDEEQDSFAPLLYEIAFNSELIDIYA